MAHLKKGLQVLPYHGTQTLRHLALHIQFAPTLDNLKGWGHLDHS
jgi:hypothetical protein